MQSFTIKDIENLTGIKAYTLRIWEQRYRFFTPKRKESLHRIYDNEDLKQLLRISFLYNSGWKISKIANLSSDEVQDLVKNAEVGKENYRVFVNHLIEAALDFNEYAFIEQLNRIIETTGFEKSITEICYPFLLKIGHLWSTNNVIPAQEHFSSYIIQNRIIVETNKIVLQKEVVPEIILMCPRGEFHELPLLFINYLLKKQGWGTIYLGTNVKIDEMEPIISLPHIRYLYLHLITNFTGLDADDYFENLCKRLRNKMIIASGEGVRKVQRNFNNLLLLKNDQQITEFIARNWIGRENLLQSSL